VQQLIPPSLNAAISSGQILNNRRKCTRWDTALHGALAGSPSQQSRHVLQIGLANCVVPAGEARHGAFDAS
jgi:hypothetical protein